MLYEIQPTGPAHRLATQQVGYDQKGKSSVQRRKLQQHSQKTLVGAKNPGWSKERWSMSKNPGWSKEPWLEQRTLVGAKNPGQRKNPWQRKESWSSQKTLVNTKNPGPWKQKLGEWNRLALVIMIIINMNTTAIDCIWIVTHIWNAPYKHRHVVPSAASLAGM